MTDASVDLAYIAAPASDEALQSDPPKDLYPTGLYPAIEPYNTGHLNVGDGHRVYYEQCGNPTGSPALFLHGGPGGGCGERSRRFFDPDVYRIVCLDQRGCGRSLPNAGGEWEKSIYENNTGKLVEDLEALRKFLEVEKWTVVLGGSWGSTLTLSYAIAYPGRMEDLILRGVFLFSPEEVDHLFQDGSTSSQNPEAWEMYAKYIEDTSHDFEAERTNFLGAYYKRMTGQDETVRRAAASAFVGYELSISKSFVDMKRIKEVLGDISHLIPFALFEVIYMLNAGFMSRGYLLANVNKIVEAGHRVRIVHGRADYVCQPKAAHTLYKALKAEGCKDVTLEFVAGAGHSDSEPGIIDALVRATNELGQK
ncbi:hypothetical protein TrST_g7235 [Triparma strigata]|uniref:Proline iminopeptidase n=1 Tax=Triparma strigata TaxID=1606541 RepID=A0A9W7DXH2_9STRA|nr:hypothetical protein TrST_g7235 [Triparma strigata]